MSGRKEDNISAKILDSIVSGLNDEPDQKATASEIGKRNAPFSLTSGFETKQFHVGSPVKRDRRSV